MKDSSEPCTAAETSLTTQVPDEVLHDAALKEAIGVLPANYNFEVSRWCLDVCQHSHSAMRVDHALKFGACRTPCPADTRPANRLPCMLRRSTNLYGGCGKSGPGASRCSSRRACSCTPASSRTSWKRAHTSACPSDPTIVPGLPVRWCAVSLSMPEHLSIARMSHDENVSQSY